MAVRDVSDLIFIGLDVLATAVSSTTNLITAQIGDVVKQNVVDPAAEWWQHVGFASRPSRPQSGKQAAQCVVVRRSDNDAVVASRDSASAQIYGQLDYGETAVYSTDGKGVAVFKKDGSIVVTAGAGGAAITVGTDGSVKIGGASPVALARGDALNQVIQIVITALGGNCVNGAPLTTSAAAISALQAITVYQTKDTTAT